MTPNTPTVRRQPPPRTLQAGAAAPNIRALEAWGKENATVPSRTRAIIWGAGWAGVCALFLAAGALADGELRRLRNWLRSWRDYLRDEAIDDRRWADDPDLMDFHK